jgi:hypothetical protein
MDERVLGDVLRALEQSEKTSALTQPNIRRMTMKSPITKFAVAATVIAVAILGLFEFIGAGSTSGIVWAEVARKVEASRGLIVRCAESIQSAEEDYSIKYFSPTHSRTDTYKGGQLTQSYYTDHTDSDTETMTAVYHARKHYMSRTFKTSGHEFLLEQHDDWMNPRYLVQTILSCEHKKLGQKNIEGVLCEGIETTDPASMGPTPEPIDRLEVLLRLWVNVETGYPVLFENKISGEHNGQVGGSEGMMDQFQWDVDLDPEIFEPNIPPDYTDMRNL